MPNTSLLRMESMCLQTLMRWRRRNARFYRLQEFRAQIFTILRRKQREMGTADWHDDELVAQFVPAMIGQVCGILVRSEQRCWNLERLERLLAEGLQSHLRNKLMAEHERHVRGEQHDQTVYL